MEYVYQITIDGVVRYIGRTNDIRRRQNEHNRHFRNDVVKELYNNIRLLHKEYIITLEPIKTFKRKTDTKRYECLLILQDYFGSKILWQKCPRIAD
jgi:predicted GIY-YIG superfamily endonuclease